VVLSYFFRSTVARQSTLAASFAISILTKLCQNNVLINDPEFQPAIAQMLRLLAYYNAVSDCPLVKLLGPLSIAFRHMGDFTLIVDGLDECADDDDSSLLFKHLQELGSSQYGRVILLSRKQAKFDKLFKDTLQLPMDQSVTGPDIVHFVVQEINRNPKLQPLKTEIQGKALKDCQGMFLWAKLLMESLRKESTVTLQREVLKNFPTGLFDV
jgi:hypothetical protein